ncbi:MAG: hypothetical protein ACTSUC_01840, partial [Promethearchaeota archaeon]
MRCLEKRGNYFIICHMVLCFLMLSFDCYVTNFSSFTSQETFQFQTSLQGGDSQFILKEIGQFSGCNMAREVFVSGNCAYVACDSNGLSIL